MNKWKVIIPVAAFLLFAGQAAAQTDEEERQAAIEAREVEMKERLRAAEARMAEAAREIAEITKERLPRIAEIEKRFAWSSKPMIGVTIEGTDDGGPVEGVAIIGITPGSAAADAGLRSGDVMTSVNDEALSADNSKGANERLYDFMTGVEEGDVLTIEYLRDGKVGSVELEPRVMADNTFVFAAPDGVTREIHVPAVPAAPELIERFKMEFGLPWAHTGLGELELVSLNEGLGKYFGTDTGLLVVKAPEAGAFDLQDGDVIQSIDGREPKDVRHALRILGSYSAGEKLKLGIMRDKKKRTIDVEIPDQHGSAWPDMSFDIVPAVAPVPFPAPSPSPAAEPMVVPLPDDEVVIIDVTS